MALLLSAAVAMGILQPGRAAVSNDEPAQPMVKLAYDQPLPDSVKRSLVEINVIDVATKAPIALAEVRVLNYVDLRYHRFPTNRQGNLRVAYPYSDHPMLNIEVRKEGYVPQRASWGFEKKRVEAPRRVTIALRRGVEIGGIVVDEAGKPIEEVTVVASVDNHGRGTPVTNPLGYEILYEVPFRTGRDGHWHTSSCPPTADSIDLQLIHPDYVSGGGRTLAGPGLRHPSFQALRTQTDRQVMTKGVRLSGRVTDVEGKPIPGARICESSRGLAFLEYVRNTATDLDGRFHLQFDPDEKIKLTVQVNGFEPVTRALVAKPNVGPVDFQLDAGKVIRGRVVDLNGKPIAGANVIIPRFTKHEGVFLRTWTDHDGRFTWGSAPSEPVELSISADGYMWIERAPFAADDKETVVRLKPSLTVIVRVREDATGRPINNASIESGTTERQTGRLTWRQIVALNLEDGDFRVTMDAAEGPYQLRVRSEGFEPSVSRPIRGDEKQATEVINLTKSVPH
jgi:hypothetical protein